MLLLLLLLLLYAPGTAISDTPSILQFSRNFGRLVLGCIEADLCK